MNSVPEPGVTVKAMVVKVKDGDTIRVAVTREFDVRLIHPNDQKLEFNSAELNTEDGKAAKQFLQGLLGFDVTVFVPTHGNNNLIDWNSFNRVLGQVWTEQGKCVTDTMLECGFGKLYKKNSY
jgi:endonuclease YncB( thermonuclease family)